MNWQPQAELAMPDCKKREEGSENPSKRGFGRILAILVGLAICVQALATLGAKLHPILELAAHCSLHSLVLAGIFLPLFICLREWTLTFCVGLATVFLLFLTQPWNLVALGSPPDDNLARLKVLSWNLHSVNPNLSQIAALIRREDPDILVLIEVRPGLLDELDSVTRDYPCVFSIPSWGGHGIAILSRIPDTQFEIEEFEFPIQPAIVSSLPVVSGDSPLQIVALHTLSPLPPWRRAIRDRQLDAFLAWSEKQKSPLCVCGDLNITPWAPAFRRLVQSGFQDSRLGAGNCATWPSGLGMFGIPIDHALSKNGCQILNRRVLADAPGSDHRAIVFEVAYRS